MKRAYHEMADNVLRLPEVGIGLSPGGKHTNKPPVCASPPGSAKADGNLVEQIQKALEE